MRTLILLVSVMFFCSTVEARVNNYTTAPLAAKQKMPNFNPPPSKPNTVKIAPQPMNDKLRGLSQKNKW